MLPLPILIGLGLVLGWVVLSPAGPMGPPQPTPTPTPPTPEPWPSPPATTATTPPTDAVPPFVSGFEHVWHGPEHWRGLQHVSPNPTPPVGIRHRTTLRAPMPPTHASNLAIRSAAASSLLRRS